MKKVKECTKCGKYNSIKLDRCSCGHILDSQILYVDDDAQYAIKNEEVVTNDVAEDKVEEKNSFKICPLCGSNNLISETHCTICNFHIEDVEASDVENPSKIILDFEQFQIELDDISEKKYIGRDSNEVLESFTFISRRHCSFYAEDGKIFIEDEGSRNGTFYNGKRLCFHKPEEIKDSDELLLSKLKCIIRIL